MKIVNKVTLISIIILYVLSIKSFAETGKINIEATRIRKENSTTSEILTVIYEGDEVEILEKKGEWIKIKYKNYAGYIMEKYVDTNSTTSSNNKNTNTISKEENTAKKEQVSVYDNQDNSENVNSSSVVLKVESYLRIQPSVISKKTEKLISGINLTIKEKLGKWILVTDGTVSGWIIENKVTLTESGQKVTENDIIGNDTNTQNVTNTSIPIDSNNTVNNNIANETTSNTTNTTKTTTTTNVSKKGKVNVETAKVRKEPSTSAGLLEFLDYGDEVVITKESGDWYYIQHQNIEGYVNKRLITIINEEVSSRNLAEERKENTIAKDSTQELKEQILIENDENQVVAYAKQYLNYPYVVGGKTPESGFDCSGFTRYVYKNFGYNLATTAAGQTSVGREISRDELNLGDLILFYNEGKTKIGHTGIYIGNGEFIHSANPERGVVIDNLNTNSYYNERYVTARRIVE